jgi:hypothetical protein
MNVIDNFLTPTYANDIEGRLQSMQQPWFFSGAISGENFEQKSVLNHGFSFLIHSRCDYGWIETPLTMLLRPFLFQVQDTIGAKELLRCRVDMTVASGTKVLHTPHVDIEGQKNITTIYYVSDSDGETVVYNERERSEEYSVMETVSPKKNRLIFFDGDQYHTGHSPMKYKNRILINSNFI